MTVPHPRREGLRADPGTYALVLECRTPRSVQIGRWGRLSLETGRYVYVGSAFGPGGAKARLSRHFRRMKAKHWHIDYLRGVLGVVGAWVSHHPVRREHRWASFLSGRPGFAPVPGFGCSDCDCPSHLFHGSGAAGSALDFDGAGGDARWHPFRRLP